MLFRCPKCGIIITINLEKCNDTKYLECINPECGYVTKNKDYRGEKQNG